MNEAYRIGMLTIAVEHARAVFNLLTDVDMSEIAEIKVIARHTAAEMKDTLNKVNATK